MVVVCLLFLECESRCRFLLWRQIRWLVGGETHLARFLFGLNYMADQIWPHHLLVPAIRSSFDTGPQSCIAPSIMAHITKKVNKRTLSIARVQKSPDITLLNSLLVYLSFCVFVWTSRVPSLKSHCLCPKC